jgi:3-oxoacyl-[acyl-carrier protein] reductase
MRLKDTTVVVTGGASGIGIHYCHHLLLEGARVLIADNDVERVAAAPDVLRAAVEGASVHGVRADVVDEHDVAAVARQALDLFGAVDVLVNNVGTYPHTPLLEMTLEEWRRVMTVNLDSVFLCSRAFLPSMRDAGRGKIINVATDLVWVGLGGMAHYVAAKAGVVGFTRALAREVGELGVTVNALAPGPVVPDLSRLDEEGIARVAEIVDRQCVKWCQRPDDLVGPLVFLASPDSDFVSGQVLTVDGGLTNH